MKATTIQQIARWVKGRLQPEPSQGQEVTITQVSTDTRNIELGDLLVALKGENFDAHEFIERGKAELAAAVIVEREVKVFCPQIIVKDTRLALGDLARAYRQQFEGKTLGITGSNGKTTVKEMLASICKTQGDTLATAGNFNNDIGLPLTLFNLEQEDYAVIEMGANHHGEISYLTNIATPDVAVITHAGSAHLEGFGDIPGVAKAKGEIYEGLRGNGVAIINADDVNNAVWFEKAKSKKIITFGLHEADFSADWKANESGTQMAMQSYSKDGKDKIITHISMQLLGVHNVMNALAAAAAASAIGIDLESIKQGLENMQPVKGRLQWNQGLRGMRVLDDTYNANPTSLSAGLAVLATVPGEHWLILGDMGELGDKSEEMHEEAGRLARRAGVSRMLTFGNISRFASEFFGEGGDHFTDQRALLNIISNEWDGEGAVLVKGSRAMQMEQFVDALKKQAAGKAAQGES